MDSYGAHMFTANVQTEQDKIGSADRHMAIYEKRLRDPLDADARAFIESRDSFYMASVSETGWPYVQHRGGPVGFLKVLGPEQIGFADYPGNKQMISKGNLVGDARVSLFLMDYPRKTRLKLIGHARMVDAGDAPDLVEALSTEGAAEAQRVCVIDLVAMDWNCPKYITPRLTEAEIEASLGPRIAAMGDHIAKLEARLDALDPEWRTKE
ncbi:MAG: pyridoxamine 5'-phosphate oxidase family protein [Pseudomonadota bacterium]